MRTTSAAGEEGRGLLSEELDASAIVQRDNFSLVLLLQGLQGAEQHSLIQAMELWGRTETPINRVDRKKKKKKIISGTKPASTVQGPVLVKQRAPKSSPQAATLR